MNPDDPKLTAYALGELSGPEREALEKHLSEDPALRAEADETAAFAQLLSEAFHAEPSAPLEPAQRAEVLEEARHGGKVIPFFRRPAVAWTLGLAAALAVAAVGAQFLIPTRPSTAPLASASAAAPTVVDEQPAEPRADALAASAPLLAAAPPASLKNIQAYRGADRNGKVSVTQAGDPKDFDRLAASGEPTRIAAETSLKAGEGPAPMTKSGRGELLDLTNAQVAPSGTLTLQNAETGATLDLTSQNSRKTDTYSYNLSNVSTPIPRAVPPATSGARSSVETKVQSQVGFAGQAFGNGVPIDERTATALAKEAPLPAAAAAPAENSAALTANNGTLITSSGVVTTASAESDQTAADSNQALKSTDAKLRSAAPHTPSTLLRQPEFTGRDLAAVVNSYVAFGEEKAVRDLATLAAGARQDLRLRERIGLVCQVLYTPRTAEALRPPRFASDQIALAGASSYTGTTTVSAGTLTVAKAAAKREQTRDAAAEETVEDYLAYCRANGVFRTIPIPATPEDAAK